MSPTSSAPATTGSATSFSPDASAVIAVLKALRRFDRRNITTLAKPPTAISNASAVATVQSTLDQTIASISSMYIPVPIVHCQGANCLTYDSFGDG